jgi:hypothetical protein
MTDHNTQGEPRGNADSGEQGERPGENSGAAAAENPRRERAAYCGVGRFVVNTSAASRRKPRRARQRATGREPENYTAAALSAFQYCDQTVHQFRTLVAIAATILRAPPATEHERLSQQTMMQLLLDTVEHYQRGAEDDRALFEVLVLDARNLHGTQMRAGEALKLLGARRTQSARCQV